MLVASDADLALLEPPERSPNWLSAVTAKVARCGDAGRAALGAGWSGDGGLRAEAAWAQRPLPRWPEEVLPQLASGDLIGASAPRLVLVGERRHANAALPFHSRCGPRLWQGLRAAGWDELACAATNAVGGHRRQRAGELEAVRDYTAPFGPRWVALGEPARKLLARMGIEHVAVEHPQYHARFRASHGARGYAQLLLDAGLEPGPWRGEGRPEAPPLPVIAHVGRHPWADLYGLPLDVAYRREPGGSAGRASGAIPARERLEAIRARFVSGEAATVKEAAAAFGVTRGLEAVQRAARDQGWHEERARADDARRRKAADANADAEAKAAATARRMAWASTNLALSRVVQRLQLPLGDPARLEPTAADAARLGTLAMALADVGDERQDAELAKLRALPMAERCRELGRMLTEQFGPEVLGP